MISISKEKSFREIEKEKSRIMTKFQKLEAAKKEYLVAFKHFKKINNIENDQFEYIFLHPERYFFVPPWNTNQKLIFQKKEIQNENIEKFINRKAIKRDGFLILLTEWGFCNSPQESNTKFFFLLIHFLKNYSKTYYKKYNILYLTYFVMSKYKSPLLTYPKSYFRLFDGNLFLDHPSLAQKQLLSHENFEFLFLQEITSEPSIKDNPQYPLNQPFSFDISLPFNPQPSFDPSLPLNPQPSFDPSLPLNPQFRFNKILRPNPEKFFNSQISLNPQLHLEPLLSLNPQVYFNPQSSMGIEIHFNPLLPFNPRFSFYPERPLNPQFRFNSIYSNPKDHWNPQLPINTKNLSYAKFYFNPQCALNPQPYFNPEYPLNPKPCFNPKAPLNPKPPFTPKIPSRTLQKKFFSALPDLLSTLYSFYLISLEEEQFTESEIPKLIAGKTDFVFHFVSPPGRYLVLYQYDLKYQKWRKYHSIDYSCFPTSPIELLSNEYLYKLTNNNNITIECTPSYKYLYKLTGGNITITSQIAILVAKCLFTTNLHKTLTIINNSKYFAGFSNFLFNISPHTNHHEIFVPGDCCKWKTCGIAIEIKNLKKDYVSLYNKQLNGMRYLILYSENPLQEKDIKLIHNLINCKPVFENSKLGWDFKFINRMNVIFVTNSEHDLDLLKKSKIPQTYITINHYLLEEMEELTLPCIHWLRTVFAFYGAHLLIDKNLLKNTEKQWGKLSKPKKTNSLFEKFLQENCEYNESYHIAGSKILQAYKEYCFLSGDVPLSKKEFKEKLLSILETKYPNLAAQNKLYYRPHYNSESNPYCYMGIRLKQLENSDSDPSVNQNCESANCGSPDESLDYETFCKFLDSLNEYIPKDFFHLYRKEAIEWFYQY